MTDPASPGLLAATAAAFRDHGLTAAITALIGGFIALFVAVTRRAFIDEARLQRLDRELIADRERVEAQRPKTAGPMPTVSIASRATFAPSAICSSKPSAIAQADVAGASPTEPRT